jgi:TP901 family phage tail tape measure protein
MADETISTRIVANADFSGLIADVHRVTASLSKLQQELASSNKMLANQIAVMNRSFSDTLRSTGQYSTHFVSLQSDVEKFGKNLDGGKLKLNQYFNTFRDQARTSGGLIRDLAKQQVALQNAVLQPLGRNAQGLMQFNVHVPRGLDEVKNKTAIARQELQIMNKVIQDGAGQLINWGKNTQWAGRQLTVGLTVPLIAFGKAAADAFKQADQELVRLTKVYGDVAGSSAAELGKVRDDVVKTAKEISSAMGVSFKETIGLAADIAATGKTGDELLGSIKETTRLAVLGEVDRQDAMKATLAIQSAFKQNTDELSKSINFLNAVENQTSTTLNDLVEAIPKAGPVIQGLGGSVQDLALYLTAMREGGINASEGANALKSALASLINPTDVAVGKFQTLGIDLLGIVNNNAGDLTGTLMTLQAALDNLDPLQKQQAIEQLFGKFQFARLNALFENLGRQGSQTLQVLDLMKASSEDLAAVAGRELSAVTESASGKYRRAIESLRASLAEVGEQFLQINTVLIQVIDKVIQFANNLPGPVKQVLALAGGFTAVIGPVIMLTGVLANFFGYILKGIFHMKAFFKGGEGWKYLTPEMLAAEKAGKLVEQSFYSDAKAAAVLKQALGNLIDEFSILEAKAKSGAMSVNPAVSTMAGNLVMAAGGQRVVDPSHPLAGTQGTRASSHMVPRSGMTDAQRVQQTMFGMVPGSIPVNQRIGQNPQIYMNDPLPNVSGLTTVKGTSTGIVAGEAARWHTMMATLGMQSKAEIENLKRTMAATGTVSKEFMMQFDDILPHVSVLTNNAAKESALIVAELRAGKINLDAARAKIVALNLETERLIAATVQAQATAMGRTINPTMVPTLNQPVVDPTGKSNMRELFKKGKTKDFINKVAGTLGVRTSGAGYNIETTIPKKFAQGGMVYRQDGSTGPEFKPMGTDTVPAMLTPGEFVVKADSVTPETLPYLQQLNDSGSKKDFMPANMMWQGRDANQALAGNRPAINLTGQFIANDMQALHARGLHPMSLFYDQGLRLGYDKIELQNALRAAYSELTSTFAAKGATPINSNYFEKVASSIAMKHLKKVSRISPAIGRRVRMAEELLFIGHQRNESGKGELSGSRRSAGFDNQQIPKHLTGTGSGFSGSQNASHFALAQDLYESPPTNKYTGPLGSGNTISRVFGAERGHMGPKIKPSKWNMLLQTVKMKSRFAPIAKSPESIALTNKWRRGYSNGGMVYMANGGMVPNTQYLQEGSDSPVKRSAGMGGMGYFMGGMGLQMAGGAVGGTAGSVMSNVGMAMNFMPMLGMLPKLTSGTKLFSGAVGALTGMIKGASVAIKAFALANPILLGATVAIAGLITAYKTWQKNIKDTREEQTALFGMSKKGAEELGINYVSLTDKLKAVREEQKLAADKAKSYFESYTTAGGGLTLTIKQLKELKERVKSDMPETMEILNRIDSGKINEWAANLKAQMIAGGKSVEDATNLIYALIESSNKAGMGITAITDKAFSAITDKSNAAGYIVKNLSDSFDKINDIDAEAFASNLDTALNSIEGALQALVGTKDEQGEIIDQAEALGIIYAQMSKDKTKDKIISQSVLKTIQSQRPELAAILNQTDTIGSMIAKWRIHLSGAALDLKNVTAEQAEMIAKFQEGIEAAGATAFVLNNNLKGVPNLANVLDKINTAQKTAASQSDKAAKGQLGASKTLLKQYQDEIKLIKERAEARKNALRETFDKENAELELQKAKLDLQNAVARGDNEAMADAQIRIQQIQKEASLKAAEAKIDENAKKEEAKQQALYDAEKAKDDKAAQFGTSKGNESTRLQGVAATLTKLGNEYISIASQKAQTDMLPKGSEERKKAEESMNINFSNFMKSLTEEANRSKDVAAAFSNLLKKDPKTGKLVEDPGFKLKRSGLQIGGAQGELNQLAGSISDSAINMLMGSPGATVAKMISTLEAGFKLTSKSGDKMSTLKTQVVGAGSKSPVSVTTVSAAELTQRGISYVKGTVFPSGKDQYEITSSSPDRSGNVTVKRKAMGGYIKRAVTGVSSMNSSQPYLVGERGPELFVPSSGGQIIPNNLIGPKYDIGSNVLNSVPSGSVNSSYNNNVYNIDIDLNGTNVTADDILRKFKSELALIGAKEGRVRTLGGEY